jgi:hypothetical protein
MIYPIFLVTIVIFSFDSIHGSGLSESSIASSVSTESHGPRKAPVYVRYNSGLMCNDNDSRPHAPHPLDQARQGSDISGRPSPIFENDGLLIPDVSTPRHPRAKDPKAKTRACENDDDETYSTPLRDQPDEPLYKRIEKARKEKYAREKGFLSPDAISIKDDLTPLDILPLSMTDWGISIGGLNLFEDIYPSRYKNMPSEELYEYLHSLYNFVILQDPNSKDIIVKKKLVIKMINFMIFCIKN